LKDNTNSLSEKYLEHQVIKAFKEVQDFEDYHRELGYRSIPKKPSNLLKMNMQGLRLLMA
jgi:hypothetical protein